MRRYLCDNNKQNVKNCTALQLTLYQFFRKRLQKSDKNISVLSSYTSSQQVKKLVIHLTIWFLYRYVFL